MSRFLRIPSSRTMELAETLYNKGCARARWLSGGETRVTQSPRRCCSFISYPRTETEVFNPGTNLHGLVDTLRAHRVLGRYAAALLDDVGA